MIDTSKFLERILQRCRFRIARPYLAGDVLDFGGNRGELGKLVEGKYIVVNYDHSVMDNARVDTIVTLAVIEHIPCHEVFEIFQKFKKILKKGGKIVLTTPTIIAKPVLIILGFLRIIDKRNITEHKHYWSKKEIYDLASTTGFVVKEYRKFQLGFNQFAVLEHKEG